MIPATRIDVHTHNVPDFYRDWCLGKHLDTDNLIMPSWSIEQALGFMDQAGIQASVLSVSAPGVDIAEGSEAKEMACRLNVYSAEVVASRPDRFCFFAVLPQQDVEASLKEINYAFDVLKADGVVLRPHVDGVYLGDDVFAPVLAELNERGAVILLHPSELPGGAAPDIPAFMADFLLDTVRGAISLMRSGSMDRYPDLKVILSHAGGFLPFIASRVAARVSPLGGCRGWAQIDAPILFGHVAVELSHGIAQLSGFCRSFEATGGDGLPICSGRTGQRISSLAGCVFRTRSLRH